MDFRDRITAWEKRLETLESQATEIAEALAMVVEQVDFLRGYSGATQSAGNKPDPVTYGEIFPASDNPELIFLTNLQQSTGIDFNWLLQAWRKQGFRLVPDRDFGARKDLVNKLFNTHNVVESAFQLLDEILGPMQP